MLEDGPDGPPNGYQARDQCSRLCFSFGKHVSGWRRGNIFQPFHWQQNPDVSD